MIHIEACKPLSRLPIRAISGAKMRIHRAGEQIAKVTAAARNRCESPQRNARFRMDFDELNKRSFCRHVRDELKKIPQLKRVGLLVILAPRNKWETAWQTIIRSFRAQSGSMPAKS